MKEQKLNQVEIKAKCVACGETSVLSSKQILEAERDGCPISTCCYMPMTVEKATFSTARKKKGK